MKKKVNHSFEDLNIFTNQLTTNWKSTKQSVTGREILAECCVKSFQTSELKSESKHNGQLMP
jgi:hypothetical protein